VISYDTARRLVDAAFAHAKALGVLISAAVCDAGGNLVAFGRMDGAEIAGQFLAPDKAYTAVSNRIATSELGRQAQPGGPLYGIQANMGGRIVVFGGGCPIYRGQELLGGIGVSGAAPDEDEACAMAALAAVGYAPAPAGQNGSLDAEGHRPVAR
jgi:uncharacterized protein GlcG (DUF336 family)